MSRVFKRLLYVSEHPPSAVGGQPLIVSKLLSDYDMDRLDVLCDARFHAAEPVVRETFLPCRHIAIRNAEGTTQLRPRRVFGTIADALNALRVPVIMRAAERIIDRRDVEAIVTVPWRCEFALAAYRLSLASGLPLYVFETDDWSALNLHGPGGRQVRRNHADLLRHATKLWVTSPSMAESYRERFGVDGEFLFHYLDIEPYLEASALRPRLSEPDTLRLVYTGAINRMFIDTMDLLCHEINQGLVVDGRRVELDIYGSPPPASLTGPRVRFRGKVPSTMIPSVLATADVTLIAVSFDGDPSVVDLVRTSLYTKTVDYLASRRPVLIVAPTYSAEVRYFGDVAMVVDTPDIHAIQRALSRLARDSDAVREQCDHGLDFVRANHSLDRRNAVFLRHFTV